MANFDACLGMTILGVVSNGGEVLDRDGDGLNDVDDLQPNKPNQFIQTLNEPCESPNFGSVSLNELHDKSLTQVYPNPVKDLINISSYREVKSLRVFDFSVQVLYDIVQPTGNKLISLDVSQFDAGTYFINISYGKITEIKSFIKL